MILLQKIKDKKIIFKKKIIFVLLILYLILTSHIIDKLIIIRLKALLKDAYYTLKNDCFSDNIC